MEENKEQEGVNETTSENAQETKDVANESGIQTGVADTTTTEADLQALLSQTPPPEKVAEKAPKATKTTKAKTAAVIPGPVGNNGPDDSGVTGVAEVPAQEVVSEEQALVNKRKVAGQAIKALREANADKTHKLVIAHANGVHVINHPGVFFDNEKKTVMYEGVTAELSFDESVENFNLLTD